MSDASSRSATHGLPYWELVTMVAFLMALNAAAIDVFIPALQEIGATLGIADENTRQLVITAYVIGFGAAQIVYGTLSDRFGRRPVLFVGLAIYVVASFAAIFSPTFGVVLAFRALQGVGAAATRVIAVSIVRDCFGGARMASVMSLVMMVFMTVPVLAPNLGQIIMSFGSWQEIFIVTGVCGAAALTWSALRLPETLDPKDRRPLTVKRTAEAFGIVLTNRRAFGYTLATALIFGVLFSFINQAEQIYTKIYDIGPAFTLYFSMVAVFMAAASFTNSRLVERLGMRRLSHGALVAFTVLSVLQLVISTALGGVMPFWLFLGMMTLTFCMFGFIGTNFNALALDPLGHVAGTASSVLGFMQTLGGGLLGALVGAFYDGTLLPLYAGFTVLSLGSLACVFYAEGGRLFDRPREKHEHTAEACVQTR
ncbi:Bcr/CflA family drug resistance efflux transporter [Aureimonas sp. SA4125]|uniref:multidrug effflux MFS transporter n=1 Tax=Aureimonas sp. SA4125 TaxID=2826993 RepID=UPI001CC35DB8|nr:multidrug effflux MFS transporter [Aureimonas sp. SA4125]BDA85071.1 Bcr/CflA family drug resistance efflux transporter [Aureimonas sp. SA4125]